MQRLTVMRTRALLLSVLSVLALPGTTAAFAASCGPPAPRHAWALSVGLNGATRWSTPLPVATDGGQDNVAPVATATTGVFAQDGAIYALSLSDGRELWHARAGQVVSGEWLVHGVVSVLVDQVSKHATLSGYAVGTGKRLWQRDIGGDGLYADQFLTKDGGLVWTTEDGRLQVVDLTSGRMRWSHRETTAQGVQYQSPRAGTFAGLALYAAQGALIAYDDRTGRRAWRVSGLAPSPSLQVTGSLALSQSTLEGGTNPTAVTAVDLATGRRLWSYDPHGTVTAVAAAHGGVAVAAYFTDRVGHLPLLAMLSPRTGRVLWTANANVAYSPREGTPIIAADDVVTVERAGLSDAADSLVDRDLATGHVRWRFTLKGAVANLMAVQLFGNALVLQGFPGKTGTAAIAGYALKTGHALWTTAAPTLTSLGLVRAGGGYLAMAVDPEEGCAL